MNTRFDILLNHDASSEVNNVIEAYYLEGEDEPLTYIPNTNLINLIIGSNNSGKSRFMRYLMQCKNLVGVRDSKEVVQQILQYNNWVNSFNETVIYMPMQRYENAGRAYYNNGIDPVKQRLDFLMTNKLSELSVSNYQNIELDIYSNNERLAKIMTKGIVNDDLLNYPELNNLSIMGFANFKSYYIPTLRSAHSLFQKDGVNFSKIEKDIYLETLNRYYNLDKSEVDIFTGLHLYKEILNSRNSKRSVRQSFEKFEKFISESFFGNKQVDIVAEFNKDENLSGKNYSEIISVHIEGEKETRNLYELGDGIQAIVILMYKIFMADDNSFIYIDEPELNLHPGMQRLFLEQISSNKYLKSKNLIYFISTHSNHLLDLTLEKSNISIYAFSSNTLAEQDNKFTIRNVNSGDNSILKSLGVNNSSVFLANCSIWVEGVSDRNYIKAFLNSYVKSLGENAQILKEDIDYSFFEYAGSNIEHYFFDEISKNETTELISNIDAIALSNRIFLLADSDNAKKTSKKGARLKILEEMSRENFHPYVVWGIREIENILTKEIWKEILISICNKELVKESEEEIKAKINNALNQIDLNQYRKEYIGEFLNAVSQKVGKLNNKNIINESSYVKLTHGFGTLTDKREMSELLNRKQFDWKIFKESEEIERLTLSIYEFILSSKS